MGGVAGARLAIWFVWAKCGLWAPAFAGVTCWACGGDVLGVRGWRVGGGGGGGGRWRGCCRCEIGELVRCGEMRPLGPRLRGGDVWGDNDVWG